MILQSCTNNSTLLTLIKYIGTNTPALEDSHNIRTWDLEFFQLKVCWILQRIVHNTPHTFLLSRWAGPNDIKDNILVKWAFRLGLVNLQHTSWELYLVGVRVTN